MTRSTLDGSVPGLGALTRPRSKPPAPATTLVPAAVMASLAGALLLLGLLATPALAQGAGLDDAGAGTAAGLRLARFGNHAAFTAVFGLLLVPALLAPAQRDGTLPRWARRVARPASGAALLWAASALLLFVFGLSAAVARPLPEALGGDLVGRFAVTRFGTAVLAQAVWALLTGGLALAARRRPGAQLALAGAAFGGLGPAWWGHAPGAETAVLAVAAAWVHVLAVGAWVGGLAALVLVVRPRGDDLAAPARSFSRLAGVAVAVVALTGAVNTLMHTTAPAQLVTTGWGRLALAKLALLGVLVGLGYAHRRASLPRLAASVPARGEALFRRLAAVEFVVMLAAVGLAATMASGVPAEAEAALQVQSVTTGLGAGQVNVTVDPARTGRNELHLYVFDDRGGLRDVDDATVTLRGPGGEVVPHLLFAGPGHFTAPDVRLAEPGQHTIEVRVAAGSAVEAATLTIAVR